MEKLLGEPFGSLRWKKASKVAVQPPCEAGRVYVVQRSPVKSQCEECVAGHPGCMHADARGELKAVLSDFGFVLRAWE